MIDAIQAVLSESSQAGFWKCYYRLRFKGYSFSLKQRVDACIRLVHKQLILQLAK